MTKNQELQVLLWKRNGGVKLTLSTLNKIKHAVGKDAWEMFQKIYADKELDILLALRAKTKAEYEDFWKQELSGREINDEVIDFLISDEYVEIMLLWQRSLLESTVTKSSSDELKSLCRALWSAADDSQIRLLIGFLLTSLQGVVPIDTFQHSINILTMFADKIALADIDNVTAVSAKYKLLLGFL